MKELLNQLFLGNTAKEWLITIAIIAGGLILCRIFQSIVLMRLKIISTRTSTTADDFIVTVIQRSLMPFLYVLSFYAGARNLRMDSRVEDTIHVALLAIVIFFVIRAVIDTISYSFGRIIQRRQGEGAEARQAKGILLLVKIIVWTAGAIFFIDNLGYNITTIITGLGIGGIAIALAAQTVLGDLFSYLVIFFDKPFETGDFIIVGDKMGTVEYIGIKTTRLRALGGEQLIMANSDLTNSRVQNYKRMEKRRIVFSIGVSYDTTSENLNSIPHIVKHIIEGLADVQFDRAHLSAFGEFSLNFEVVYFIQSADYNIYMDRQQEIYLGIAREFGKSGIEFAYPTQKLLLKRANEAGTKRESFQKLTNN